MRYLFSILFFTAAICSIISCRGKDKGNSTAKDTLAAGSMENDRQVSTDEDSTLAPIRPFLEQELANWMQSFTGLHIDSFRMVQKGSFEQTEHNETTDDLSKFYELYKASLSFSPDSSQFIDLYSSGIMLEKKGKKIIAIADVDQAITICNLGTKEWKRIASFGPSAGIEEAIWISPSKFILAGIMYNDNGKPMPILLLGDINNKSLRWFEANTPRPESVNYEASGMKKLKIDEWE